MEPVPKKRNTMTEYLFVYDEQGNRFPVRLRILRQGDDPLDVADRDQLTGTVELERVEAERESLSTTYPKPAYSVSRAWANTWKAVENNYRGLRDHSFC